MQKTNHSSLIILGSGPAGCTAALYAARANLNPILIAGSAPGGQLITTTMVDNWPGEVSGIGGIELMEKMLQHVQRFQTQVIYDQIVSADLQKRPFYLQGESEMYSCDALIIATGASARYLGSPSEQKFIGRGVSACATCDGYFYRNQKVAVVGGGNTAIYEALYLAEIASEVVIIHRRDQFRAEPILVDQLLAKTKKKKITFEWNTTVKEVLGNESGVTGLSLQNSQTGDNKNIDIKGVFIAIGHKPNTDIFQDQLALENGYIQLLSQNNKNLFSTATNIEGVFAAGDVADQIYKQAITSAGTGCRAALDAKKFLMQ
ncbi:MAG: thioredoxin-disulfide reductase [Gammaproteobacteria bacterium GWE2_37_16]|nr:MAG: thioredoxin-disulfide reductase [Gammaproteobacteria bacterium GWE2_37_16]